jgi:LAS superfamily LD-carboxypeptidase LdcB
MTAFPDTLAVTGNSTDHLADVGEGVCLHREVLAPFRALAADAAGDGIALRIASGFRSFERQLAIWNGKALGRRAVLDDDGRPLILASLSDRDKVFAILRWSALPGASRHHWGTDLDIWDAAAVPPDYRLRLENSEYGPDGPFHRLGAWLDVLDTDSDSHFFRPYRVDLGGIGPEPWHISYRPLAAAYESKLTLELLRGVLENTDIALREAVLDNLEEIFERFVSVRA